LLPGFDLNELWPARTEQHPLILYFLGGTIASLAAFATRIFTTVLAVILIASISSWIATHPGLTLG
jgi:hypothetical protein